MSAGSGYSAICSRYVGIGFGSMMMVVEYCWGGGKERREEIRKGEKIWRRLERVVGTVIRISVSKEGGNGRNGTIQSPKSMEESF